MDGSDEIEKLLKVSGLSVDDLLSKLQQYKSKQNVGVENSSAVENSDKIKPSIECIKTYDNGISPHFEGKDLTWQSYEEIEDTDKSYKLVSNTLKTNLVNNESTKKVESKEDACKAIDSTLKSKTIDASKEKTPIEKRKTIKLKITGTKGSFLTKPLIKIVPAEDVAPRFSFNKIRAISKEPIGKNDGSNISESSRLSTPNKDEANSVDPVIFQTKVDNVSAPRVNVVGNATISDRLNGNKVSEDVENDAALEKSIVSPFDLDNSSPSTSTVQKSEDNLRDTLRMQLSSLRNMKKQNGCLPDLKKTSITYHSMRRKRKSCDVNNTMSRLKLLDEDETKLEEVNKDVVSLADETQFVILEVTGGVDRVSSPKSEEVEDETTRRFASISNLGQTTSSTFSIESPTKAPGKECDVLKDILSKHRRKMSLNYFNVNSFNFTKSETVSKPATINVANTGGESFGHHPGVSEPMKNSEKSPFVSDSLDDFLNENSQLKVSYPIPKLGAEEGLMEKTKKSPFDDLLSVTKTVRIDHDMPLKQRKIKAKTLADMRRQVEKLQKKKSSENTATITRSEQGTSSLEYRNSYVLYNKKKIWVPSNSNEECLATIEKPKRLRTNKMALMSSPSGTSRRPSLLSTLPPERKIRKVKYKPGPMCKKAQLQSNNTNNQWMTEVKPLPKIFLEVTTEVGKPVDPKVLHLLPIFDNPIITADRTQFALGALKTKVPTSSQPVKFPVHYLNKQENLIVRRKRPRPPAIAKNDEDDADVIAASVVEGLLNYVEIKEIAPTLIKEEEIIQSEDEVKILETNSKTKVQDVKRKRLDKELLRLSCKVIDVGTNSPDAVTCTKASCRMGCVCKSLACECFISNHCQLVDCMFECKCPASELGEILASHNTLSVHTVNNLDDKAKRNLAKVEREFTQTLIHTDDDVILVGTGGRNKVRRSCKLPKRYSDFVESDDKEFPTPVKVVDQREQEAPKLKKCTVDVVRLNLDSVVPLCFHHKIYNCSCKGKAIQEVSPKVKQSEDKPIPKIRIGKIDDKKMSILSCARTEVVDSKYAGKTKTPSPLRKVNDDSFSDISSAPAVETNVNVVDEMLTGRGRKRKQSFEIREDPETRSLDVSRKKKSTMKEFAMQRRRKILPKSVVYRPIFDGEIKVVLSENQDMLKIIGRENAHLEYLRMIPWKNMIKSYREGRMCIWSRIKKPTTFLCNASGYHPPKSYVDIKMIADKSDVIQWILTGKLPPDKPADIMNIILTPKSIHFMISGFCLKKLTQNRNDQSKERSILKSSSNSRLKLAQPSVSTEQIMLSLNNSTEQVLLNESIPETKEVDKPTVSVETISSERDSTTSNSDNSSKVSSALNESAKLIKENLLSQNVPGPCFDIANLVALTRTTSSTDADKDCEIVLYTPKTVKSKESTNGEEVSKRPEAVRKSTFKSLKCTHKDMKNEDKTLLLSKRTFPKRVVYEFFANLNGTEDVLEISVSLPQVWKEYRWRMIYLISDFSYLSFVKRNYSIKYNDLMDLVKMANKIKSTVILRNRDFCSAHLHPLFGIFCVPQYLDRLFIGPFAPNEDHNIETLRYIHGSLVNTITFNHMLGRTKRNVKAPVWIYECESRDPAFPRVEVTIDITHDEDDVEITKVKNMHPTKGDGMAELDENFFCPPFVTKFTGDWVTLKKVNKFIVTNIPRLGHFRAYVHRSGAIDVQWPSGCTIYRFVNVEFAKNCLILFLSQIFTPLPSTFTISVVLVNYLNQGNNDEISAKYLLSSERYICGEFGFHSKSDVPQGLLRLHKATSFDSLLQNHKLTEDDISDGLIKCFAAYVMKPNELVKYRQPEDILQWALSEIYVLNKLSENYQSQKADLENLLQVNSLLVKKMQGSASAKVAHATPLNPKLNSKEPERSAVPTTSAVETIEIVDSDEDTDQQEQRRMKFDTIPTFQKITMGAKVAQSHNDRSLLKSKFAAISPGKSLLKVKAKEDSKKSEKCSTRITINQKNNAGRQSNVVEDK